MNNLNYYKWFVFQCNWQFFSSNKNKIEYTKSMLKKYLKFEDLDNNGFNNKTHIEQDS